MTYVTLHTSLSTDPMVVRFDSLEAARRHMVNVLVREGWPAADAAEAAEAGAPVLVADSGDDETIEIRSL